MVMVSSEYFPGTRTAITPRTPWLKPGLPAKTRNTVLCMPTSANLKTLVGVPLNIWRLANC